MSDYSLKHFMKSQGLSEGEFVVVRTARLEFRGVLKCIDDIRYTLVLNCGKEIVFVPWKRIIYIKAWNGKETP